MQTKKGANRLSIGFSRGALRSLLLLALIASFVYAFFTLNRPSADTLVSTFTPSNNGLTLNVNVLPNGDILVNDELIDDTVRRTTTNDEVRTSLISEPGKYIGLVQINVNLPAPALNKEDFVLLAIHGAALSDSEIDTDLTAGSFTVNGVDELSAISLEAKMRRNTLVLSPRAWANSLTSAIEPFWWWIIGGLITLMVYLIVKIEAARLLSSKEEIGFVDAPPSNLTPAAAGLLVNGKSGYAQIAATLVYMAQKGDIQLVQTRKGYRVARKKISNDLSELENLLIDELRLKIGPISDQEVIKENLHQKLFSRHMTEAFLAINHELETRGFFANDDRKKNSFRFWGTIFVLLSIALAFATPYLLPEGILMLPTFVGTFLAGWIIFTIAPDLPNLTSIGQRERSRWQGFIKYLCATEPITDRQRADRLFSAYLPYAISFGVVNKWMARFQTDFITIPEWYFNEENPGSSEMFVQDMGQIITDIGKTLSLAAIPN